MLSTHLLRYGLLGLAGGLVWLSMDFPDAVRSGVLAASLGALVFVLINLSFIGECAGLRRMLSSGSGSSMWSALGGALLTLIGHLFYAGGALCGVLDPSGGTIVFWRSIGAMIVGIGMLSQGMTALVAPRFMGWRGVSPLVVGLYYMVMLAIQIAFFMVPYGMSAAALIAFWGVAWAALGIVVRTRGVLKFA
jgi:hypothetical protein